MARLRPVPEEGLSVSLPDLPPVEETPNEPLRPQFVEFLRLLRAEPPVIPLGKTAINLETGRITLLPPEGYPIVDC